MQTNMDWLPSALGLTLGSHIAIPRRCALVYVWLAGLAVFLGWLVGGLVRPVSGFGWAGLLGSSGFWSPTCHTVFNNTGDSLPQGLSVQRRVEGVLPFSTSSLTVLVRCL